MPAPLRAPGQAGKGPITDDDLTELFVARQQPVKRLELAQRARLEWSAHVFIDKQLEPIPQAARLRRDGIKLARKSVLPESLQHVAGRQSGLLEPGEKILAAS